jgi:hypothetical protein
MTSTASPDSTFRQGELDKFDELAQRLRMDAQAGAMRHGWLGDTA